MTTSMQWLESYNGNRAALSFIIEGFGTVFATETLDNTYSIASAPYSDWTSDPTTGMVLSGEFTQGIKLYDPSIEASTITVSVVDKYGTLAGSLFREGNSSGHQTYLTSSVTAGSTAAINVNSTTGFAASGTIYIGGEAIAYTGKTATTFTGITRGKYSVNTTDSGSAFAPAHLIGNNVVASARTAPVVSDFPRTWYGRFCHVLLHVRDPLTHQWNTPNDATKWVTGRIENYSDLGNGTISIEIKTADDLLYKPIGPDQWSAYLNEGMYLTSAISGECRLGRNGGATSYMLWKTLTLGNQFTHSDLATVINQQFITNTWDYHSTAASDATIAAGDDWRLELLTPSDGGPARYRMRVTDSGGFATTDHLSFGLGQQAAHLLGFAEPGDSTISASSPAGGQFVGFNMHPVTSGGTIYAFECWAPKPPIVFYNQTLTSGSKMNVSSEINSFITQTATDFLGWNGANGCVQIKGGDSDGVVAAVKYTNGSPSTIEVSGILNSKTGQFYGIDVPVQFKPVRLGEAGEAPTVRQVLCFKGGAGTLLLNLILSTGAASYNHSSYDSLSAAGFGAGIPASLVDIPSFEALDDVEISMVVADPKALYQYIEPVLAVSGRYIVWRADSATAGHKLTVVKPSLDSVYQTSWHLTESNKAGTERTKVSRTVDGLFSRVVVKYGHGLLSSTDPAVTLTVEDIPSQSDYGRRRTVTINAPGVVNAPEMASQMIGPALSYFSRPVATLERSFNASLARMAPGDSVALSDNYVVDPATGTRGTSSIYGWVLDTKFDFATGKGVVRVVHLPEKYVTRVGRWSPSGRVQSYSGDVSKILTIRAHEYSEASTTTRDAERFAIGDKVRVVQLDEPFPIAWLDTVAAVTSTTVTLTAGSGGLYDSTKQYVLVYQDSGTVTASQKESAFLDYTDAYEWGHQPGVMLVRSPTYTQGHAELEATTPDVNDPLSVNLIHQMIRTQNNFLGYRSRSVHANDYLGDQTQVGTTDKLVYLLWVPFYGHAGSLGTRGFKWRVRGRQSGGGTATFTVASSPACPTGQTATGFTFGRGALTSSITTTSATNVWTVEGSLSGSPTTSGPNGGLGTWIGLYIHGSGGGISAIVNQIWVAEEKL